MVLFVKSQWHSCILSRSPRLSREGNLSLVAALKYDFDEDPDKLVAKFINALETLHTSHKFRLQAHKDIPSLTEEQQQLTTQLQSVRNVVANNLSRTQSLSP
jgi:hypothetical protein